MHAAGTAFLTLKKQEQAAINGLDRKEFEMENLKKSVRDTGARIIHLTGLFALLLVAGCISDDLVIRTSGTYSGTYVSVDATYDGPLFFDFQEENQEIDAQGEIVVGDERIEFEGHGTITKSPWTLTLDVTGTDFVMHIEGSLSGGHLEGYYSFTSSRWGNDSGSIDMHLG